MLDIIESDVTAMSPNEFLPWTEIASPGKSTSSAVMFPSIDGNAGSMENSMMPALANRLGIEMGGPKGDAMAEVRALQEILLVVFQRKEGCGKEAFAKNMEKYFDKVKVLLIIQQLAVQQSASK